MTRGVRVIAIDGPVAAGKTVVGRELARRLGFRYLDTGVMYRAITWLALKEKTSMEDEAGLEALALNHPIRLDGSDSDRVAVGEYKVGPELRESDVDRHVSLVSRVSGVRRALVAQQRTIASEGDIVMVGRDIGTVVLPNADLKVFISASLEERARRRWRELVAKGTPADFQQVLEGAKARDDLDSQRADSPLQPAKDAWFMETDAVSADDVVEMILEKINQSSQVDRV
ncbi:MAG: (d)CMP kinase [Chloroflexi bacterium]|nr:(d)CMP kinase [Chloroflexota bacterium]